MNRRLSLVVRWSAAGLAIAAASAVVAVRASSRGARPLPADGGAVEGVTDVLAQDVPEGLPGLRLREAGRAAGFLRAPFAGRRTRALPEDMGTGVALFDADGDGDLDVLLAGSGPLGTGGPSLLYRNDGGLRFTDVSDGALPAVPLVGTGVAAADADGDGDVDALVTGYGRNLFLRNRGDGTFEDDTDRAGLRGGGFCTSAAWSDLDGDGRLDVYVARYVAHREDPALRAASSRQGGRALPAVLNPSVFDPEPNLCFRNRGDGTFEETAGAWGIADPRGKGLGVAAADLDGDGRPEIYVANDVSDNVLFRNLGGGRFEDASHSSCAADPRGAMGLAVEDVDGDAMPDIYVTHWIAQENALFRNGTAWGTRPGARGLFFADDADALGLGASSLDTVGWGCAFTDLDGDGRLDLIVANGSTFEDAGDPPRLLPEPPLLYWNTGRPRAFLECARRAGEGFAEPRAARSLAAGDLDGDGDEDFVVTVHGEPPALLVNDTPAPARLVVRLRARSPDRAGRGARVAVTAGGRTAVRWVGASPSYLATSSTDLAFGLGGAGRAERIEVRFPSGATRAIEGAGPGLLVVEDP